jgi:AAA family ATP:ADP antiporter
MGFVPLYSWFSSQVNRARLVLGVTLFFILNLELFCLGARMRVPYLEIAFFIWVAIFNNAIIAQFWSYGNDLYRSETGERLFPVIAIGSTLGAPVGAALAAWFFKRQIPAYRMLHITAVFLLLSMAAYWLVEQRERKYQPRVVSAKLTRGVGGFTLLAQSRYLWLICLLLLLLNLVNTTGQYVLDHTVMAEVARRFALDPTFNKEAFTGAFYGDYFFWGNVVAILVQSLVASRIVKYLGVAGALLALPVVALSSYGLVAAAGVTLAAIRFAKIAENGSDYSIMNTARQMLWLPTSRDEKYKAKQAADTFIVRTGDLLSAGLVFVGTHLLHFGLFRFASANVLLCALWLGVGVLLIREYRARTTQGHSQQRIPGFPPV